MKTENLSTLKINKLSQAQYDRELAAGRIDPNAIYLTPDEASSDGALFHASSVSEMTDTRKTYIDDEGNLWKHKPESLPETNQLTASGYNSASYITSAGTPSSSRLDSDAEVFSTGYMPISSGSVIRLLNCRINTDDSIDYGNGDNTGCYADRFYLTTQKTISSGVENSVNWTNIESCSWISDIQYDDYDNIYGFTVNADGYLRMTLLDYSNAEYDEEFYLDRDDYAEWMDDVAESGAFFVGIQAIAQWSKTGVQYRSKQSVNLRFVECTTPLSLGVNETHVMIDAGTFNENTMIMPMFKYGANCLSLEANVLRDKNDNKIKIQIMRKDPTDTSGSYSDIYVDYWVLSVD